jgi:hypothetical protein
MAAGMVAQSSDLTLEAIRSWPATVGVRQACEALGISGSWGYSLLTESEFPCKTIAIRGRTRVITASLVALLETGVP